jgi:hypothetical protein
MKQSNGNLCTVFHELFIISLINTTHHLCHAGSLSNEQSLKVHRAVAYARQLEACHVGGPSVSDMRALNLL